ncbi:BolA/IbaG family iron-sulfur metabolism protein [Avibacterium sp. 20-126]|uniref:BolA family protein n=1 Tax=Avibacterium sp. 20-126 TaxID=2911524 RepID=UPI002188E961|nr:BolA/IbaG family iron-sulfur metabolism protein [Avibacterium sp. 20-126]
MSTQQILTQKIQQKFAPHFLHIENESHMHSSGRGADSHFKVVLVSDEFNGVRKVARHQMLYQLLAEELKQGIHALALHTYTLDEWHALEQQFPKSPNCLGVGQ